MHLRHVEISFNLNADRSLIIQGYEQWIFDGYGDSVEAWRFTVTEKWGIGTVNLQRRAL